MFDPSSMHTHSRARSSTHLLARIYCLHTPSFPSLSLTHHLLCTRSFQPNKTGKHKVCGAMRDIIHNIGGALPPSQPSYPPLQC